VVTYCCRKAISVTYSKCEYVAVVIQHATRMRHIAICGLSGSTIFFPHYLTKGTILGGKNYSPQNVRFDFLYNFCLKHSHCKQNSPRYCLSHMYIGLQVKCPLFVSYLKQIWIFFTDFQKKSAQIQYFMKIRPVGAELFHADRRTYMHVVSCARRQRISLPRA
jgi:hypothetical protein